METALLTKPGNFRDKKHAQDVFDLLEPMITNGYAKPHHIEKFNEAKEMLGLSKVQQINESEILELSRSQAAIDCFVRTIVNPLQAELAATPKSNKLHSNKIKNKLINARCACEVAREILQEKTEPREIEERIKGILINERNIPKLQYAHSI
jgi:hypothetical protein